MKVNICLIFYVLKLFKLLICSHRISHLRLNRYFKEKILKAFRNLKTITSSNIYIYCLVT